MRHCPPLPTPTEYFTVYRSLNNQFAALAWQEDQSFFEQICPLQAKTVSEGAEL